MKSLIFLTMVLTATVSEAAKKGDDEEWVHLPNKCEVCKFVSIEMKSAFEETGKTKEVIDTNYRFLDSKGSPPIKYVKSDIRFIEVVENVCQRLSEYNLHKERTGSNRFAKWAGRKGDVAAIGEEKKKKKKAKKGKGKESEGAGQETPSKKKDKKAKKKKKGKKVEEASKGRRGADGHATEEDVQRKAPLPSGKTEL
ncbi:hypothetical protein COCON_G00054150 [Conger conger]|uniref:Protein canopy homolog 3 n=1 Tax=Conger conger TaxID=82655 RepID=A0A9Q1DW82_CONCO|nr:hypothetical protein COCON_G00054150 [Conger conger]